VTLSRQFVHPAARWGVLTACLLAAAAGAQDPQGGSAQVAAPDGAATCTPAPPLCLERLACMSWPQLEQLYRQAEAGAIPQGYARGLAVYCPDGKLASVRSRVSRALWHGKVFDACDGTLVNQWCGFRAIKARVSYGPSCLDGRLSIIMDYRGMSHVWADVRDEVREVAPGLYIGRMYRRHACGPEFKLYFVLQACAATR
jgi:hypothetical protein